MAIRNRSWLLVLIFLAGLFHFSWSGAHAQDCTEQLNSDLLLAEIKIYESSTESVAIDNAEALFHIINTLPAERIKKVNDDTIDALAALLTHKSNGVKVFAAHSLAVFGARADRSLPALRRAEASYQDESAAEDAITFSSMDGRFEIATAIEEIEIAVRRAKNGIRTNVNSDEED